jgi:hypothetical protein
MLHMSTLGAMTCFVEWIANDEKETGNSQYNVPYDSP